MEPRPTLAPVTYARVCGGLGWAFSLGLVMLTSTGCSKTSAQPSYSDTRPDVPVQGSTTRPAVSTPSDPPPVAEQVSFSRDGQYVTWTIGNRATVARIHPWAVTWQDTEFGQTTFFGPMVWAWRILDVEVRSPDTGAIALTVPPPTRTPSYLPDVHSTIWSSPEQELNVLVDRQPTPLVIPHDACPSGTEAAGLTVASVTGHSALFDLECMIPGMTCSGARGNCEFSADQTLVFDGRTRTFHKTEASFWAGADRFASSETRFAIMGQSGISLVLLDATTGKRVREWQFLEGGSGCVGFTKSGQVVVVQAMKAFSLSETGQKPLSTVQLPDLDVNMGCTVRFVGDELVVLAYEGATRIADGGIRRHAFARMGLPVFSEDARYAAIDRGDRTELFDVVSWTERILPTGGQAVFDATGRYLATGGTIWSLDDGKRVAELGTYEDLAAR